MAHELMKGVVLDGTARGINPKYYSIAGKTGTAQLNYHKFKSKAGIRHQAGFCGFFPADNPVLRVLWSSANPNAAVTTAQMIQQVLKKLPINASP